MGRREEKREATRQEILGQAKKLFLKRGYDNTSVDEVAEAANVAKGTFYYNFTSKEDLVRELRTQTVKQSLDKAELALKLGVPPLKVLQEMLIHGARWTEGNKELSMLFFTQRIAEFQSQELAKPKDEQMPLYVFIRKLVSLAQSRKEIRQDIDSEELAKMIGCIFIHARMTWLIDKQGSLETRVKKWWKVFMEGLQKK